MPVPSPSRFDSAERAPLRCLRRLSGAERGGVILPALPAPFLLAALPDSVLGWVTSVVLALLLAFVLYVLLRRRSAAETELRFSRSKFAGIVGISSDAIVSVDRDQLITDFNTGAEQIFGYAADDVLGKPLSTLIPPRFSDAHERHIRTFIESPVVARRMGERRDVDIVGLRGSGEEFPAEASISKIRVGERLILTVVLRDITRRRRAEEAQRFLARAGAVLAGSLDYRTTLDEVARLPVPDFADWCAVYILDDRGLIRREALACSDPEMEPFLDVLRSLPPVDGPHPARTAVETGEVEVIPRISEALEGAIVRSPEHREALRKLGFASAVVAPLIARGTTTGAVALYAAEPGRFGREEAYLAEELARRAALAVDNARLYRDAQQALKARDEVLSVVSHDLGNPLSAIFIGTRLLLRTVPEEDRAREPWTHLDSIRQSAEQMQRLIRDLLDVQRLEAGRMSLEWERHAPQSLVVEAIARIEPLIEDKALSLVTDLDPELPFVRCDRDRMMQVFGNLLGNAVKFTDEGRISVSARAEGPWVRFTVADTGAGIGVEELPHVFDRFWQARRRGRHGAGLGLAIARGIVDAHGGSIEAESEPGRGTRIRFTVPAVPGDAAEPA